MNYIIRNYLIFVISPFRISSLLKKYREQNSSLEKYSGFKVLNFNETLIVSWLLFIINCFYSLCLINISNFFAEKFGLGHKSPPHIMTLLILLKITFFPLVFWAFYKVWYYFINFFGFFFFEIRKDTNIIADQVVFYALTSHIFLLIPVIGVVIKNIVFLIFLYAGLCNNMGLSKSRSLMVILSPLFTIFFLLFLLVSPLIFFLRGFI
jgi:hypothetical protein